MNIIFNISALFTLIITVINFARSFKGKYDKERFEKVAFPLFLLMEPHLYHKLDSEVEHTAHRAIDLIAKQQMIAGGRLTGFAYFYQAPGTIRIVNWVRKITKHKNKKTLLHKLCDWCERKVIQCRYNNLCDAVCSEYDILCRRLGVPRRRFDYKLAKRQFRSLSVYIVCYTLFWAGALSMLVFFVATILRLVEIAPNLLLLLQEL